MRTLASAPVKTEAATTGGLQRKSIQAQLKHLESQRAVLQQGLENQLDEMNQSQEILNDRLNSVEQQQQAFERMVQGANGTVQRYRTGQAMASSQRLAEATERSHAGSLDEVLENATEEVQHPLGQSNLSSVDRHASTQAANVPQLPPQVPQQRDVSTQLRSSSAFAPRGRSLGPHGSGHGHTRHPRDERPQVLAQLARDISDLIQSSRSASAERRSIQSIRRAMPEAAEHPMTRDESNRQGPLHPNGAPVEQQAMDASRFNSANAQVEVGKTGSNALPGSVAPTMALASGQPATPTPHPSAAHPPHLNHRQSSRQRAPFAATATGVNEPLAPVVPIATPSSPQEPPASEPLYQSGANTNIGPGIDRSVAAPSREALSVPSMAMAAASSVPPAIPSFMQTGPSSVGASAPSSARFLTPHRSGGGSPKRRVDLQVEVQRPNTPTKAEDTALQSKLAHIEQREEGLRAKVAQLAEEKMNQHREQEDEICRLQALNCDLEMELETTRAAAAAAGAAARGFTASLPESAWQVEPQDPWPPAAVLNLKKQIEHVRQEVSQAAQALNSTPNSSLRPSEHYDIGSQLSAVGNEIFEEQINQARNQVHALQGEVQRATAALTGIAVQKEQKGMDSLRAQVGALRADLAQAVQRGLEQSPQKSQNPEIAQLRMQFDALRAEVDQSASAWQPPPSATRQDLEELHIRLKALQNEVIQAQSQASQRYDQKKNGLATPLGTLIEELRAWRTDGSAAQAAAVEELRAAAQAAKAAATVSTAAPSSPSAPSRNSDSLRSTLPLKCSLPPRPTCLPTESLQAPSLNRPTYLGSDVRVAFLDQSAHSNGLLERNDVRAKPFIVRSASCGPGTPLTGANLNTYRASPSDTPRRLPPPLSTELLMSGAYSSDARQTNVRRGVNLNTYRASPSDTPSRLPPPLSTELMMSGAYSSSHLSSHWSTSQMTPPWRDISPSRPTANLPVEWSDRMLPDTSRSHIREGLGSVLLPPPPLRPVAHGDVGWPIAKLEEPAASVLDKPGRTKLLWDERFDMHAAHRNAASIQPPMLAS